MTNETKSRAASEPLSPSTREHGVWGTKSDAVGGFGESYQAQVASGAEPNPPDDERRKRRRTHRSAVKYERRWRALMSTLQICASQYAVTT